MKGMVAADGRLYIALEDGTDVMQGGLLVLDAASGREIGFVDTGLLGVAVAPDALYTVSADSDAHDRGVLRAYRSREVPIVADLPGMTLTPGDLADAGLTGFGLGAGETAFADQVIASTAEARGMPEEAVRSVLEGAGLTRRYASTMVLPADPSDPGGPVGVRVSSYVTEFRDAAGAADAWDLLEDESGSTTARDLEVLRDLGDGSEVTSDEGTDASGAPFSLLDLTIRRAGLHLGVTVVDWTGGEPSVEGLAALAERVLERGGQVVAHPTRGLGGRALRITGPGVTPIYDRYTIVDGVTLPLQGEPPPGPDEGIPAQVLREPSHAYEVQVHVQRPEGDSWISSSGAGTLSDERGRERLAGGLAREHRGRIDAGPRPRGRPRAGVRSVRVHRDGGLVGAALRRRTLPGRHDGRRGPVPRGDRGRCPRCGQGAGGSAADLPRRGLRRIPSRCPRDSPGEPASRPAPAGDDAHHPSCARGDGVRGLLGRAIAICRRLERAARLRGGGRRGACCRDPGARLVAMSPDGR